MLAASAVVCLALAVLAILYDRVVTGFGAVLAQGLVIVLSLALVALVGRLIAARDSGGQER